MKIKNATIWTLTSNRRYQVHPCLLPEAGCAARNVPLAPKRAWSDRTDADRGDAGASARPHRRLELDEENADRDNERVDGDRFPRAPPRIIVDRMSPTASGCDRSHPLHRERRDRCRGPGRWRRDQWRSLRRYTVRHQDL